MMTEPKKGAIEVFYSYSHRDEKLRSQLEIHLITLKRQGLIVGWNDRNISAGQEWAREIDTHLKSAHLILLLVSSYFLASDYCFSNEMQQALERHKRGEARVIPIILRHADWHHSPLGTLQALPKDGKPVTSWSDREKAFLDIAQGIRTVIEELSGMVPTTSERQRFSDAVRLLPEDALVFDSRLTKDDVIDLTNHLSDSQFQALNDLIEKFRIQTQGIVKSYAIEIIGGKTWKATETFEALVRFGFFSLSTDPIERNDPDPAYDYTWPFIVFKSLLRNLREQGTPEADYQLASRDDKEALKRVQDEMKRQTSEIVEQLEQWKKLM